MREVTIDSFLDLMLISSSGTSKLSDKVKFRFVGRRRDDAFLRRETEPMSIQDATEFIKNTVVNDLDETSWTMQIIDE
jgi:hypothetical protein